MNKETIYDTLKSFEEALTSSSAMLDYLFNEYDFTIKGFSDRFEIPYRTVQNWRNRISEPPLYVIKTIWLNIVLEESYTNTLKDIIRIYDKLGKAQDLLHDKRFSEAIEIIDNI